MNEGTATFPGGSETEKPFHGEAVASSASQLMLLMEAVSEEYAVSVHAAVRELVDAVHLAMESGSTASGIPMAQCRIKTAQQKFDERVLDATSQLDSHRQWFIDEIRNLDNVLVMQKFHAYATVPRIRVENN